MASTLTHISVAAFAYAFPFNFSIIGLLVGATMPELDYLYYYIKELLKEKNLVVAYYKTRPKALHSIFGSIVFNIPVGILLTLFFSNLFGLRFDFNIALVSVLLGVISHLVLDLPAHRTFTLFFPRVRHENPFTFKMRLPFFERFYPARYAREALNETNWLVFSHIFAILIIAVCFFIRML